MRHTNRITIVSETFYPEVNGVTNTLNHLVTGLQKKGYQIQVIRPRQHNDDCSRFIDDIEHITVKGFPIPGYPELRFGIFCKHHILNQWQERRPTAVYIATEGPLGWSAISAAKHMGLPVLTGFHTNFQSYSSYYGVGWMARLLIAYGRLFHNRTDGTIVPTHQVKNMIEGWGFQRVSIIGRGVNCDTFSPAHRNADLRTSWQVKEDTLAVLYVGRLAAEKNLELAVKTYLKIHAEHPNSQFILVGDGPLRKSLQQQHPEFIFAGMQRGQALSEHFASGDVFLFPSKTDTFGNVVTEALASGLGVVAFNEAAAGEYIESRENGMLAKRHDDQDFINAGLQLAHTPDLLGSIRREARKTALKMSWENIVNQFEYKLLSLRPGVDYYVTKQNFSVVSKNRSN